MEVKILGSRAVITTSQSDELENSQDIGLYTQFYGPRDCVEAFLTYCKMRNFPSPERQSIGWHGLCTVMENFSGENARISINCVILAPTTMMKPAGKKKIKTDKRDAALIARCLASNNFSPVHVPTTQDEEVKEFLRMRDDHKLALKKVKQQILAFCLRHGYSYTATKNYWTSAHIAWLRSLKPEGLYSEILSEYLLTFQTLSDKLDRLDQRIEELAAMKAYSEGVKKLSCFLGSKTHTALATMSNWIIRSWRRPKFPRSACPHLGAAYAPMQDLCPMVRFLAANRLCIC